MPRFFIEAALDDKTETIRIAGEDHHHIAHVLRLQPGQTLTVCDGHRRDYVCEIAKIDGEQVYLRVLSCQDNQAEPPYEVTLYQGLAKGDKMDQIIQKAVELGAVSIVPVICARSVVRIKGKDIAKKTQRWQKIATEAAKQCGRGQLPEVKPAYSYLEAINALKDQTIALFPWESERKMSIREFLAGISDSADIENMLEKPRIGIMIGPEGGFSAAEINEAEKAGITPVSLGRRILRTETAGTAVLAMLAYQYTDF